MMFICSACKEGNHCGEPDGEPSTWCDCQHRTIITDEMVESLDEERADT